jgi:hypothetical protein
MLFLISPFILDMKRCTKCNIELEVGVNITQTMFNNYDYTCKPCRKVSNQKWKEDNKEHIIKYGEVYREANRDKQRLNDKIRYQENKEQVKAYQKEYYKTHERPKTKYIPKPREKKSKWVHRNPGYYNRYHKDRKKVDPIYKLICNTRSLIGGSFKRACNGTYKKSIPSEEILGCTLSEFISHIQSSFKSGMTLDNYGEWELDHIVPISSANSEEEIVKLNYYTNYQPLWKEDNLKKSNKIVGF